MVNYTNRKINQYISKIVFFWLLDLSEQEN